MRYCRFSTAQGPRYGLIELINGSEQVTQTAPDGPLPIFVNTEKSAPVPVSSVTLLEPVRPSKILCVGRNYADHAKELGNPVPVEPLIFLKPPSSLIAHGDTVVLPGRLSERVEYEGELALVIARTCHNLGPEEDVRPYIFGYTCANDVTARDLQKKDGQWWRAKGFDTFCPVGPVVSDEIDPWAGVQVETRVNGVLKQSASTAIFIFPLDLILRYIAQVMTLLPGDIVLTGTPAGVGPLVSGDQVEVSVEGIGTLRNHVK
ncbi:MAG TPA: fumarylacetoacetate hydrolase family protein [Candidatus Angelobacter sp.]|nr:fumarylacetoacetate hydrolase family protein [Candidatus Angelobacter sp.]